jgi:hypothetical protein
LTWKYCKELTALAFSDQERSVLKHALLTWPPHKAVTSSSEFGPVLGKLYAFAASASTSRGWYLKPGVAEADAEEILKQAIALHERARALQKELLLAELELGKGRKRIEDIQACLNALVESKRHGNNDDRPSAGRQMASARRRSGITG